MNINLSDQQLLDLKQLISNYINYEEIDKKTIIQKDKYNIDVAIGIKYILETYDKVI